MMEFFIPGQTGLPAWTIVLLLLSVSAIASLFNYEAFNRLVKIRGWDADNYETFVNLPVLAGLFGLLWFLTSPWVAIYAAVLYWNYWNGVLYFVWAWLLKRDNFSGFENRETVRDLIHKDYIVNAGWTPVGIIGVPTPGALLWGAVVAWVIVITLLSYGVY